MKPTCPHCGNDDESMLEEIGFIAGPHPPGRLLAAENLKMKRITYLCVSCSKEFTVGV